MPPKATENGLEEKARWVLIMGAAVVAVLGTITMAVAMPAVDRIIKIVDETETKATQLEVLAERTQLSDTSQDRSISDMARRIAVLEKGMEVQQRENEIAREQSAVIIADNKELLEKVSAMTARLEGLYRADG